MTDSRRLTSLRLALPLLALLCLALAQSAEAKPARCFSTDEGDYACDFRTTDGGGSFEVSATGKPTYALIVDEPGVAFGFVDLGSGNVALPGRYLRSNDDSACWVNDTTQARLCAW